MDAGLQIYNTSNIVQIDSTFKNLELKAKGSYSLEGSNANTGVKAYATITFTGNCPLVAFTSSGFCFMYLYSLSGNTYTYRLVNIGFNLAASGEYFIFDDVSQGASTFGLQVFNASASMVYDALAKYARVIDFYSYTEPSGTSEDTSIITKQYAGCKPAVVQSDFGWETRVASSPTDPSNSSFKFVQQFSHGAGATGDTARFSKQTTYVNASANNVGQRANTKTPSVWLVLDVANY